MKAEVDWEEHLTGDAELVVVAYGICSRIAKTAVEAARREGIKAGLFRLKTLFPFPSEQLAKLAEGSANPRFLAVEMSNGQMIDDVKLAISCRRPVELVNRMGGHIVTEDQILGRIRETKASK